MKRCWYCSVWCWRVRKIRHTAIPVICRTPGMSSRIFISDAFKSVNLRRAISQIWFLTACGRGASILKNPSRNWINFGAISMNSGQPKINSLPAWIQSRGRRYGLDWNHCRLERMVSKIFGTNWTILHSADASRRLIFLPASSAEDASCLNQTRKTASAALCRPAAVASGRRALSGVLRNLAIGMNKFGPLQFFFRTASMKRISAKIAIPSGVFGCRKALCGPTIWYSHYCGVHTAQFTAR